MIDFFMSDITGTPAYSNLL